ncbi:MAG: aspartate/glutamate racemase family protein [Steroidobacteraceae bacterium]
MPRIHPPGGEVSWPADEGVLGVVGVAPWATLDFCRALYEQVAAAKDWHYPRVLLDVNTKLPSRGRHLQLGETDPSPAIAATIRELAGQGATLAVVVCNTAHILFERWSQQSPIPVLDIVEETIGATLAAGAALVTPFASRSLADSDLYGAAAQRQGLQVHRLAEPFQGWISGFIEQIKVSGALGAAEHEKLGVLAGHLRDRGVDTVILACTELSLLQAPLEELGLRTVDSNRALARAALLRLGVGAEFLRTGS